MAKATPLTSEDVAMAVVAAAVAVDTGTTTRARPARPVHHPMATRGQFALVAILARGHMRLQSIPTARKQYRPHRSSTPCSEGCSPM